MEHFARGGRTQINIIRGKRAQNDIEVIAQQWAIKEYSLRSIGGDVDPSVTEIDFIKSVWDQALVEAENRISAPFALRVFGWWL